MNKKCIIASFLCVCVVGLMPFTASAMEDHTNDQSVTTEQVNTDFYYEYLSSETGFTVKKLKEIETKLDEDLYTHWNIDRPSIDECETLKYANLNDDESDLSVLSSSGGSSTGTAMTPTQWARFKEVVDAADILITKDDTTAGFNHGHAAIVCNNSNYTVEALGYIVNNGKSLSLDIANTWSEKSTVRAYSVPYIQEYGYEPNVADYAEDELQGVSYDHFASLSTSGQVTKTNCSTLVWFAYQRATGYQLIPASSTTCLPQDLLKSNKTEMYYSFGWGHTQPHVW